MRPAPPCARSLPDMRRVQLPHTDLQCSALGFGCNPLTKLNDRRKALALLDRAIEAGITHYDVARGYGSGHTEQLLGEFIRGRRDKVTVATKFGLQPSPVVPRNAAVITIAKRLLRLVPAVDRRVRQRIARSVQPPNFGVGESAASLETSLKALATDYVDVLLIHEGRIDDARREDLQRFLEDQVARGTIRQWGLACDHTNLEGDASRLPRGCKVVQFDNDMVRRQRRSIAGLEDRAVITYSALGSLHTLTAAAQARAALAATIREKTGLDATRREDAAHLLLGFALADNPDGIVLVGTTNPSHVTTNASIAARSVAQFTDPSLVSAVADLTRSVTSRPGERSEATV